MISKYIQHAKNFSPTAVVKAAKSYGWKKTLAIGGTGLLATNVVTTLYAGHNTFGREYGDGLTGLYALTTVVPDGDSWLTSYPSCRVISTKSTIGNSMPAVVLWLLRK